MPKNWATFVRKFVAKTIKKLPNMITLRMRIIMRIKVRLHYDKNAAFSR